MDDTYVHSHYVFWRMDGTEVEIQIWPPTWWLLAIMGFVLLAMLAAAVVLVPRLTRSRSAGRDEQAF